MVASALAAGVCSLYYPYSFRSLVPTVLTLNALIIWCQYVFYSNIRLQTEGWQHILRKRDIHFMLKPYVPLNCSSRLI